MSNIFPILFFSVSKFQSIKLQLNIIKLRNFNEQIWCKYNVQKLDYSW